MLADAAIAPVASLLADPARVAILWALLDGRELPSGELAHLAGVTPATASLHLAKLMEAGFVGARPQGRHRYYRLTRPELAPAMEALAALAPPSTPRTHRQARIGRAVRAARTCYDHLAGRLGVGLAMALVEQGTLVEADRRFEVTPAGERRLGELGVDVAAARARRRSFAPACLDWSERVPHVAGSLGAALLARFLELGWIERASESRAVGITLAGRRGFAGTFGINS